MKAWKIEHNLRHSAKPEENFKPFWSSAINPEKEAEQQRIKLLWGRNVPGSNAPEHLIVGAIQAKENMGFNVSKAEKLLPIGFEALQNKDTEKLEEVTAEVFHILHNAKKKKNNPYSIFTRPLSFYWISRRFPKKEHHIEVNDIEDKICGGWYGQTAGALMGTSLEGYTHNALKEAFGEKLGKYIGPPDTTNDGIKYEIAFLEALKEKGKKVKSKDIALKWAAMIPSGRLAEQITLNNIRHGIFPPESGRFHNPFQEWIGAAMRTMVSGLVSPGRPHQAAYLAFLDSQVSHSGNGIYGGIFIAVLVSLAFTIRDTERLLIKAARFIPRGSELESIVWEVLSWCQEAENDEEVIRFTEKRFKRYNWIHLYPNVSAVITALYFSKGNFEQAMKIIASFGYDTDCNGGIAGTVLGVINGKNKINDYWFRPFNGKIRTCLTNFEEIEIDKLCKDTINCVHFNEES
jgi:ADP-ribosylglycohydrolase